MQINLSNPARALAIHDAGHIVVRLATDAHTAIPAPRIQSASIVPMWKEFGLPYTTTDGAPVHYISTMEREPRMPLDHIPLLMELPEWASLRLHTEGKVLMDIVEDLAGPMAECLDHGLSLVDIWHKCEAHEDMELARQRVAIMKLPLPAVISSSFTHTHSILEKHWGAVLAVANALEDHIEIDGQFLEALAEKHGVGRNYQG